MAKKVEDPLAFRPLESIVNKLEWALYANIAAAFCSTNCPARRWLGIWP